MIIKSMSRKHPTFAQLIDYIEGEAKLKSRRYCIHHNLYSRDSAGMKREFEENAEWLRSRKNGVYLYHEVVSITPSEHLDENAQKQALSEIVREYLKARGRCNMAYAVLHEDTGNLHCHIVMSSNAVGESRRTRLSKEQFADIQTRLEAWVLTHHRDLEQKAVFHKNQTKEEREAREAKRAHLSNKGEQMKRRGAEATRRDAVQEKLAEIFETATDPRHFSDLMEKAGFTLYTRGKNHGATDRDGNKYRFERLGLGDAWQALDARMTEAMKPAKTTPEATRKDKGEDVATSAPQSAQEQEIESRLDEINRFRSKRAEKEARAQATAKNRDQGDGQER
jgi:hypothetical protein